MRLLKLLSVLTIHLVVLSSSVGAQQKQHFKAVPKNQQVSEGGTAVMECEVGNQRGRVQWAKDGFVLGFNRSIPGYPRYEMTGDGEDGKHHLRIFNATLEDDANYQCQVGPADGHPPIRATGRLIVLIPPSKVSLIGRVRNNEVELNEGEQIHLECLAENSKPVASVNWFKDGVPLNIKTNESVEESAISRRHHVRSKLTLKLNREDDGARYTCQADHQALDNPLKSTVTVSVLYPPGPPIITGYTSGESIRAGEERMFTCRSKGGNPLARVVWLRNNVVIDTSDRQMGRESVNDYRFVVEASDNMANYTCEVRNQLTDNPLTKQVTLSVLFPPERVEVSGPHQAKIGDNVTVTCFIENTNPPATVSWVIDGKQTSIARTKSDRSSGGGWNTVSTLIFQVPKVDHNIMFSCHANNEALGKTSPKTFLLSVLRPPQRPEIYGHTGGVQVGVEQSLRCISRGSNPPAELHWYRNGEKVPSQKHTVGEESKSVYTYRASAKDNGAQLRCEASNAASSSPVSVSVTLKVFFPPDYVQISVNPLSHQAGNQANLTCRTGPSNPPSQISWLRSGFRMSGHRQESQPSSYGGISVTNTLILNLTAADDGLTYTCQAVNEAIQTSIQDSVTLRVSYPAQFVTSPPESVDVRVGESLTLNLTAKANPEPIRYTWTHRGLPLPKPVIDDTFRRREFDTFDAFGSRVTANGPVLHFYNVTKDDSGDYELVASNKLGSATAKVFLNVQYGPSIERVSEEVSVSEGEDAKLECTADGNPLTESMVTWSRQDYDFTRTEQSHRRRTTILKVLKATKNDTGHFTCIVDNGIGRPVTANITLIVSTKPVIRRTKLLSQAAAPLQGTGRLCCEAEGAPDIKFSWKKGRIDLTPAQGTKYTNETRKVGLITWVSTLEIKRVSQEDYGHYECTATNNLGSSSFSILFSSPTSPEPPLSFRVVNTTHDAVLVDWVPGFDGGITQYFRLRYRIKDSVEYHYVDVYEPGVYAFVVSGLSPNTEYYFSIKSRNDIGESEYIGDYVRAVTLSHSTDAGRDMFSQFLGGRNHLPQIVIVVVATVGTMIVILNIALVICLIRRKRTKKRDDGSDQASSKSTTNTMYAPSSYNDTVVGETLSSISEKSRESYAQDDSIGEYEACHHYVPSRIYVYDYVGVPGSLEQTHKHAASTYLIDQIEPPPEYASKTPSQPSSVAFDPHEDDYAEVLRRNAYNHQLGKTVPRPPSRATHYSTSPESRGYMTFSYTPSPTGVPNGAAQYHGGPSIHPSVTLGLHDHHISSYDEVLRAMHDDHRPNSPSPGIQFTGMDLVQHSMGLEQHSIPSEQSSLTLDPHTITVDHPMISVSDLSRGGELRVQPSTLSTFNPNSSPSTYSGSDLEGHLV